MSTEDWKPDITVTDEIVSHVINAEFRELSPVKVELIGEGWDNKVFMINDKLIFRFPHRKTTISLINKENKLLNYLKNIIDLKVPNPIYIGKPCKNYPYSFHGYEIIPGKSACHASLTKGERHRSITTLANFLKKLHGVSATKANNLGLNEQIDHYTNTEYLIRKLKERAKQINEKSFAAINMSILDDEINISTSLDLPKTKVLVHGDLYCRHLMFKEGSLIGIIDWGDAGIGNQSIDLSVIFSFYPEEYHKKFFEIYGDIDEQTLRYARFIGLYSSITVLLYGYSIQDHKLFKEAMDSIERINPSIIKSP